MATFDETKAIWKAADAVCFDVDSTVVTDEGIDELAKFCGVGEKVAELTRNAMNGTVTFRDTLKARLGIIKPSKQHLMDFIEAHPPSLTNGIRELVKTLQSRGTKVYLVTGGFLSIVSEVAKELGIPTENIFANKLKFYFNGDFAGFDEDQPTSASGGKPKVVQMLKKKYGYKNLVMVGDGSTDMEACPPADAFIGFGGNQVRPKVQENAKWFATNFQELISVLKE
ncbi:phosphoserine phosphatase-like [Anneissia japonica]|uniref:phosphoserine phosphatase-like n=1 Tax=Anneissia japonica TaxID=1529436 RepID=UPI001425B4FB|nr:phosphoserine phosphatase-like [Anneissia japonica]